MFHTRAERLIYVTVHTFYITIDDKMVFIINVFVSTYLNAILSRHEKIHLSNVLKNNKYQYNNISQKKHEMGNN
jgi:hypothetical protein